MEIDELTMEMERIVDDLFSDIKKEHGIEVGGHEKEIAVIFEKILHERCFDCLSNMQGEISCTNKAYKQKQKRIEKAKEMLEIYSNNPALKAYFTNMLLSFTGR